MVMVGPPPPLRVRLARGGRIVACIVGLVALAMSASTAMGGDAPAKPDGHAPLVTDSTHIDFAETLIDGKMLAPEGFLLQGRKAQSMAQMVRLRANFRSELRNSKAGVKALAK